MTVDERNQLIEFLLMWSNWNREALGTLSDQKLLSEYERHNKLNRG